MKKRNLLSFVIIIMLLSLYSNHVSAEVNSFREKTCYSESEIKLKYRMQELWIEHAWWTRSYIVSNIAGLKDQSTVLRRLLKNQQDIGHAIEPYYGEAAGTILTDLLKEHIMIAGSIMDAAKKNDEANVEKFNKEWLKNADEIIDFLISKNPNWHKKELTNMFYTHLKLTTDEVTARLKQDWEGDIRAADLNEQHLIHMSDFLVKGIVNQFPNKFK
jgi:hypothetical protein